MARPTTDPKPLVMTLKLSKDDMRKLKRLARRERQSLGEALRNLLRAAKEE